MLRSDVIVTDPGGAARRRSGTTLSDTAGNDFETRVCVYVAVSLPLGVIIRYRSFVNASIDTSGVAVCAAAVCIKNALCIDSSGPLVPSSPAAPAVAICADVGHVIR
ncbi:hypothetical protein EVAR_100845_1 [Eumeta japonica]|uniref:Uncharacterized protein n=1 Tax=Eumeta variegata TaxID=151549 RepID=A0A4C2A9X4_EUMVA|nr:hypothetical protein EVAR_100845_1 [Eumeta japonica]